MLKCRLIAIEMFQNVMRHSDNIDASFFGFNESFFLSGNPINNENILSLHQALTHLNSLNAQQLTVLYKHTLQHSSFSDKGGAGLGLIQIARKSSSKLHWTFLSIDNKSSIFLLKVSI